MKKIYSFISIVLIQILVNNNLIYSMQRQDNNRKLCNYIISDSKIQEVFKLLQESDIDINYNCSNGQTPLHIACQMGNIPGIKALLNYYQYTFSIPPYKYPANINAQDKDGNTPIVYAIFHNRINSIYTLLNDKNHQIDLNIENNEKDTALNILLKAKKISREDKLELIKNFIKMGSNPNIKNKNGNSALHIATLFGDKDLVKALILNYKNIDINSLNNKGRTVVYLAAELNKVDILKEFLELGADLNIKDIYSLTPLDIAVLNKNIEAVKVLLDPGFISPLNINSTTDESVKKYNKKFSGGESALHFAYYIESEDIADLLIKKNIDQKIKNRNGLTAKKFYDYILNLDKKELINLSNSLTNLKVANNLSN